MLFRNRFCGASFLVGQGRGCSTMLPDLDVNPGTEYLDASPPPLPPTKSPSATTVEGVRGWTRCLRPSRDHTETWLPGLDVNPGTVYLDAAPPLSPPQVQNGALGGSWPGI